MVDSQQKSQDGLLKKLINFPHIFMKKGQIKSVIPNVRKTIVQELPKLKLMINNFREYGMSIDDMKEIVEEVYGNR